MEVDSRSFVQREQLRLLLGNLPWSLVVNLLNGAILVAVQWPVIGHATLVVWFAAVALVSLFRFLQMRAIDGNPGSCDSSARCRRRLLAGVVLAARPLL